jgi:hypothetical protein
MNQVCTCGTSGHAINCPLRPQVTATPVGVIVTNTLNPLMPASGLGEADGLLRALLREVSYVSKGPVHRAALEWLERNGGER